MSSTLDERRGIPTRVLAVVDVEPTARFFGEPSVQESLRKWYGDIEIDVWRDDFGQFSGEGSDISRPPVPFLEGIRYFCTSLLELIRHASAGNVDARQRLQLLPFELIASAVSVEAIRGLGIRLTRWIETGLFARRQSLLGMRAAAFYRSGELPRSNSGQYDVIVLGRPWGIRARAWVAKHLREGSSEVVCLARNLDSVSAKPLWGIRPTRVICGYDATAKHFRDQVRVHSVEKKTWARRVGTSQGLRTHRVLLAGSDPFYGRDDAQVFAETLLELEKRGLRATVRPIHSDSTGRLTELCRNHRAILDCSLIGIPTNDADQFDLIEDDGRFFDFIRTHKGVLATTSTMVLEAKMLSIPSAFLNLGGRYTWLYGRAHLRMCIEAYGIPVLETKSSLQSWLDGLPEEEK